MGEIDLEKNAVTHFIELALRQEQEVRASEVQETLEDLTIDADALKLEGNDSKRLRGGIKGFLLGVCEILKEAVQRI